MTQVDFYILKDVALDARNRFACRLIGKAVSSGASVIVHHDDPEAAQANDELLWSYPPERFLPHGLVGSPAADGAPVLLSWEDPGCYEGVLVNLSGEVPRFFARFDRVAEIIVDANREAGRERYRFYRDRGFPLFTHDLDEWEAA
jgi:DNA polymerase-3 subunit chi